VHTFRLVPGELADSSRLPSKFKFFLLIALTGLSLTGQARAECATNVGRFIDIHGQVETQIEDGDAWLKASLNTELCEGSSIRVGAQSRAAISLINDAVLRLDENTTMRLVNITQEEEEQSLLDIIKGALHSFSRKPKKLMVNSPYLNGSIEGTEFVFRVTDDQSELTVFEGTVVAANDQGDSSITGGESVVAQQGQAPTKRILVNPRDEVTWGLYYPSILISGEQSGDPQIIEIAMLLESGRINQAREKLAPLLATDNGLAYALSTIINVALNETAQALEDGARAVELAPSAPSFIALSYAQQSNLDLESAHATLQQANQADPDNALVLARLAELNLMLGNRSQAVELAQQAVSINPRLDNPQMVLGFAALALNDHATAGTAFETAISLDSSNPLSYLGLGLSKISAGNLIAGRKDIEAAVALDSNDAVIRAYLGKSYFEEKRSNLGEDQYDIAKSLDPNDPTAYLYSGILKQTENRPVEALDDIEQSIALNDNRAVYRSRLLLDQDRAARGTSIARAYNDLGFTQLAVPEASNSLLIDPSNASAHRFLSDSYQSSRRTEIGRVSELFQAQMLQDVNINPVQPSLSATNLNIVTLGGPAQAGFNEFTPLFQKNQIRVDATLQAGSNDTRAGEAAISGIYDNFSYSIGVMSYDTDGWRDNNEVEQDLANLFLQYALNDYVNFQFEYLEKDSEEGDLAFNFDPDDFVEIKSTEKEEKVARVGLRVKPNQKSTILVSYIEADNEEVQNESDFLGPALAIFNDGPPFFNPDPFLADPFKPLDFVFDDDLEIDSEQIEAQYIFDDEKFNLVIGAADSKNERDESGSFTITSQDGSDIFIFPGTSAISTPFTSDGEVDHTRSYIYYNNTANEYLQFTVGVSRDDYEEEIIEVDETNSKLGIQWMASDAVTVRAAAFETVKPILANNRTLEPSQISGFNQFYDDVNGTQSTKTGLAFDVMLMSNLYATLSLTRRELDVPSIDGNTNTEVIEEWEEENQALSLYWIPGNRWSVVVEIIVDNFENNEGESALSFDDPLEVDTVSVPFSVNYFNPNGFFVGIKGTHVDQEVERPAFTTLAEGEDDFFVVDASVGYRLPKRMGHVSLGVLNLFDEEFDYQDDSYREFSSEAVTGPYFPERMVMGQMVLNF